MKHVVMGTSGHVDHGKTTLIKRLTGIDADRLKEEKKRGMTIELGFAPMELPDGRTLSIIDVPGHEGLIKTMVAGASSIDFVLMVIAADEGVMPQTIEHLKILSLLEVKRGIIALTKMDLVDQEWLELVMADIQDTVQKTFLEDAPIIPVSAQTGQGIDELTNEIIGLTKQAEEEKSGEFFRIPIDRVFTISGHGTVITGTLLGGKVTKGDTVQIMPSKKIARVRGVQVHGNPVEEAVSGDRCALNLGGIQKEEIKRGEFVVFPNVLEATRLLDASLLVVDDQASLKHGQRVRIHIGTSEVMGKIRMIGKEQMEEGERGYVQLRTEEPIVAIRDDRYILRFYSPMRVIAGGKILNHHVPNRARFSEKTLEILEIESKGNPQELILLAFLNHPMSIEDLIQSTFISKNMVEKSLNTLETSGKVLCFSSITKWFPVENYKILSSEIIDIVDKYHKAYPYRDGIEREEIRNKLFEKWEIKDFNAFINKLSEEDLIAQRNNIISDPKKKQSGELLTGKNTQAILNMYQSDGVMPPSLNKLLEELNLKEQEIIDIQNFLYREGYLVGNNKNVLFHSNVMTKIKNTAKEILIDKGELTVGNFRDQINSNRQNTIAILEYFDTIGFTKRKENVRIKGSKFPEC